MNINDEFLNQNVYDFIRVGGTRTYYDPEKMKNISIRNLLIEVLETFPEGFTLLDLNGYLDQKYGFIDHGGKRFDQLVERGYLIKEVERLGKINRGMFKPHPNVFPLENQEEPLKSFNLKLYPLLKSFVTMKGSEQLEKVVLSGKTFVEGMLKIKKMDPKEYSKLGGNHLDNLLRKKKI